MNLMKQLPFIILFLFFYNCENNTLTNVETLKKELKAEFEIYKEKEGLNINQNEFHIIKEEFVDLNNDNLTDAVLFYEYTSRDGFSLGYEVLTFINNGNTLNFTTKYKDDNLDFVNAKNNKIFINKIAWEHYKSNSYPLIKKKITLTFVDKKLQLTEKDIFLDKKLLKRKAYVTAENGLLCRDEPNGNAIHKFPYGTLVEIIEMTGQKLSVRDDNKEISGEWVKVNIANSNKQGYIFDGFLGSDYQLTNLPKKILAFPVSFIKNKDQKAILLPYTHAVYDKNLKEISSLKIETKTAVELLGKTTYKRHLIEHQDYCKWANYVKVRYNNKEYILFGKEVLAITKEKEVSLNNRNITFVFAKNHIQEATDENGLTFCYEGGDYTKIFIKENTIFHDPKFELENSDGVGEYIGDFKVHNNIVKAHVSQGFQEGTGSFDVEFYNKNGWKSKTSNLIRDYDAPN